MGNCAGSQELIELGNQIRDRRQEIGLSQEKVVERARISVNTVSRIRHLKRSDRTIVLQTMEALVDGLQKYR